MKILRQFIFSSVSWRRHPCLPRKLRLGETENTGSSLIGIFYDLEVNQKGEAVNADYWKTLDEFFSSGWDENVLSRFFRVTRSLYATRVFIPNMGAGGAPKAFKVEKRPFGRNNGWLSIRGRCPRPRTGRIVLSEWATIFSPWRWIAKRR